MMYWGNGMSGWGYLMMGVSSLLFWALVVAAIVFAARYVGRTQSPIGSTTPEDVLAQRFARGEIDEDEYRRRLDTLRTHGRPVLKA
jgi:putative membrane protein